MNIPTCKLESAFIFPHVDEVIFGPSICKRGDTSYMVAVSQKLQVTLTASQVEVAVLLVQREEVELHWAGDDQGDTNAGDIVGSVGDDQGDADAGDMIGIREAAP